MRRNRRALVDPLFDQRDRQHGRAEQHRLGHRRALQVEQVGIDEHQCRAGDAANCRASGSPQDLGQRPRRDRHAQHRQRDRERAGPVEDVDLRRQHAEQMGQRQPDRADLLPAGQEAVEDPPRHDEVSPRVVVTERETEVRVVKCGGAAAEKSERGSEDDGRRTSREQNVSSLHSGS